MSEGARRRHEIMLDAGLLDPGQPTEWATIQHQQAAEAEFTPEERRLIRHTLGLLPESRE